MNFPQPLDPARSIVPLHHTQLPEEYIWTAGEVTARRPDHGRYPWQKQSLRTEPHFFRKHFRLSSVPESATLYVAGPREAEVWLNGQPLGHFASDIDAPIGFRVIHADAHTWLHAGENVLAVRAVRGRGIITADASLTTQQIAYGEVLAVKLVGARANLEGPVLLMSDTTWVSATSLHDARNDVPADWTTATFDDRSWISVMSLGSVEGDRDLLQWSADAGMYAWPGYQGITQPLGVFALAPVAVTHVFSGNGSFRDLQAITSTGSNEAYRVFTVTQSATNAPPTDSDAPALLLDFGREIAGRLLVRSSASADLLLSVAYGESELEALATGLTPGQRGGNYLGTNLIEVPSNGVSRGPKSGFRYARVRFLRGSGSVSIQAEGIAYPVSYLGSFESSDPLLNRIWETAAHTVHLCMQDDLWDAPKRDRGRWAGDIDVEGRIISEVFGDKDPVERTLAALAPAEGKPVNGIPNYSALWITSLESLYAHSGNLRYLRSQHEALLRVLATMDASREPSGEFINRKHQWLFIDWSPGLFGYTPEAVFGTNLQYLRGYLAAASLLSLLDDRTAAANARATAMLLERRVREDLLPRATPPVRESWQINALLVHLGLQSTPGALAHVKQDSPSDPIISPYFNLAVLDAMAQLGHGREALDWMRAYWGGMLAEGATSFWEAYDLRWPKDTPHLSLQADGTSGFFVSLAHGWSGGPAAWLPEQVLGIRNPADGYRSVTIAPRLCGLRWARGSVATPRGPLRVSLERNARSERIDIETPSGIELATVILEQPRDRTAVLLDGKPVVSALSTSSSITFPLQRSGKHTITFEPETETETETKTP